MKNLSQHYFIHFIKPSLMTTTFIINYSYLCHSNFANLLYYYMYLLTFTIKPLFFFTILIVGYKKLFLKNFTEIILGFMILFLIFFGFPIKEYIDFFHIASFKRLFEEKEYILDQYILTHFIVNILLENIPIILFSVLNNLLLGWSKNLNYDPIFINLLFILTYLIYFSIFFSFKTALI